ncbi:hypothetical protein [Aquabacterium humicola]|uniref:hypothetical protein n=1 Tax=Aquabacterium humicola TaxID=3237377 RepID=UPI002543C334|nr:hypothetical protein [Rubrivivax pictus]
MPIHIVEQGDHLSSIAEKAGFHDLRTIWDHPENAALKALRKNPHVLQPGDSVFIPEKEQRTEQRPTDALHKFRLSKEVLKLRVKLQKVDGEPVEDTICGLLIDGKASREPISAGLLDKPIARSARNGKLELADDQIAIGIGDLDPVEEQSGQLARLLNLGYYRRALDPVDEDERKSAVEEFKCDHELTPVNPECDAATQAKLLEIHGC